MINRFNPEKAVQAAGVVLRAEGKRITRLRLLKLLYIAERKCLAETGRQLIGGKLVAMDHGPLHSDILDLINGRHPSEAVWSKFFSALGPREVQLTDEPDVGRLSRYEIDLLNHIVEMHAAMDDFDLSMVTHGFPEWAKTAQEGTSTVIPIELLVEEICGAESAGEVLEGINDRAVFDEFFSG
jgi:uncharacterized phage-associated protein